jgi:hypothetical protein
VLQHGILELPQEKWAFQKFFPVVSLANSLSLLRVGHSPYTLKTRVPQGIMWHCKVLVRFGYYSKKSKPESP